MGRGFNSWPLVKLCQFGAIGVQAFKTYAVIRIHARHKAARPPTAEGDHFTLPTVRPTVLVMLFRMLIGSQNSTLANLHEIGTASSAAIRVAQAWQIELIPVTKYPPPPYTYAFPTRVRFALVRDRHCCGCTTPASGKCIPVSEFSGFVNVS